VLRISTGPPPRPVPRLEGKTVAQARALLKKQDLRPDITRVFNEKVKAGVVVSQTPPGGRMIPARSPVKLTVSRGPPPVKVPHVSGRDSDTGQAILYAAGFQVTVDERFSEDVPRGDVIRQKPATGQAPKGSTVTIFVSKGPRTFPLPDVRGQSGDAAEAQLEALGLNVSISVVPGSSASTVVGSDPPKGTTIQAGSSVTIFVA
jgi:beta-lactam-binding protein with PASTA domain